MRFAVLALLASVAVITANPAMASASTTVPTVRCPTTFGFTGPHPPVPSRVVVRGRAPSVAGLVAYTNTQLYLIGPSDMKCSGIVAVDGGTQLLAWPRPDSRPGLHSHEAALSLSLDPACAGCKAADACPFFEAFARGLGFPCTESIPSREIVDRINNRLVLFQDPSGVAGDGLPSGGPDPANGLVGLSGKDDEVYRSTCTLPAARHSVCTTSLDDVIARYG